MQIDIDPTRGVPIYLQIIKEIRMHLAAGALSPGDKLPSVRKMAMSIRVNPNTVSKAYNELERDGVIFTKRGEGTFVSEDVNCLAESQGREILEEKIADLAAMAERFDISREDVLKMLESGFDKIENKGKEG